MYIPSTFKQDDLDVITKLITDHPLGLLISSGDTGITTSSAPFLIRAQNKKLTLVAHLARANQHWESLQNNNDCVIVFSGQQNYITPNWYPTKKNTHKVVPTWNYQVVEVRGKVKVINDTTWLRNQIEELTNIMETKRADRWQVSDAPSDFIENQIKAIIGIEIQVNEINSKWKMSQNKTREDVDGVIEGLSNTADKHSNPIVAQIVIENNKN
jgi:transcriptional regulator